MRARSRWGAAVATSSSKNPWRILPGEELGEVQPWHPPSLLDEEAVGGGPTSAPEPAAEPEEEPEPAPGLPTLEEIEAIQRQAYEEGRARGEREGFEFGHREALEAARKEINAKLARLDGLLAVLDQPLKELDDQVEQELLTLVVSMVRQLVRREVRTDPHQIIGVMREALAILPLNSRNVRVMLHPDEAEIVRELYSVGESEHSWNIVEDPVVQPGGCRVVSDSSQVDATLESRLNNLIAPLLGGLRSADVDNEAG
jgi:flagellar assembly protein FliH